MTIQEIANIAALVSVFITLVIFIFQSRALIRVQRAEYIYRLEDKYDQICLLRLKNPRLVECADEWQEKDYAEMNDAERSYYHYGEMILGFFEVATYMNKVDKTIPDRIFNSFVSPMIRLELNYNAKLIENLIQRVGLSSLTKEVIRAHIHQMKDADNGTMLEEAGNEPKKMRLRDAFPGQTHLPEISPQLSLSTIVVLLILTIAAAVLVWWLKS
jgi:hypothetical protein